MLRLTSLFWIMLLLVSCVSVVACDSGDDKATPAISPTVSAETPMEEPVQTEEPVVEPSPSEEPKVDEPTPVSLEDILIRGSGFSCLSYQQVMSGLGVPTMTTDIWVKEDKIKMVSNAQGIKTSTLYDMGAGKAYTVVMGMTIEIDLPDDAGSAVDQAQAIVNYMPTIAGQATIDGKDCVIVEYVFEGNKVKMWLWEEYGFPLRIETSTPQGKMTLEHKEIKLGECAPDSVFTMP